MIQLHQPFTVTRFSSGMLIVLCMFLNNVADAQSTFSPSSAPRLISRGVAAGSYQAFPDVCRLLNGDLLCVFYAGYDHVSFPREGWERGGRICLIRSDDEGRTWSDPRVLFDGPDDDRDPHIAQMKDGTLICSFFPYRKNSAGKVEHEVAIVESTDGGGTWSERPRILAPNWAVSAPVRELTNGTRLLGIYQESGNTAYGGILRSLDKGKTWSNPIAIQPDSGVRLDAETDVIQRTTGELLAALRGDRTNLHFSTSSDDGLTWSPVRDSGFPGHCPHFQRLNSGEILLTHRLPNTSLHVSRDDGRSWLGPWLIDSKIGAYPSSLELSDGSVLVIYYEEGELSGIRQRRFRLKEDGLEFLPWDPELLSIGDRRELFVDRSMIERFAGAELKLHTPVEKEAVLKFDRPWEGAFSGYVTVIHDPPVYRMYYRGNPVAGADGSPTEVTCYAESQDGVKWQKPSLGLFEVHGTRENNVVLAGHAPFSHNFAPFLDRRPGVKPEERFKALAGTSASGLFAFASADGLRWKKVQETPVLTQGAFDSQNVAFWSEPERRYVLYLRTWTGGGFRDYRTISRSVSEDFKNWSEPSPMSFGDTPQEHLYTSQTHPYFDAPHLYIAVPMRFVPGRKVLTDDQAHRLGVKPGYSSDCAEAVFMTSRGGNRYQRTFMEAFIRPGQDLGNWASRAGLTALGVVATGSGEMSIYKQAHYAQPTAYLARHVMRRDGFASLNAGYRGGEAQTRTFIFQGNRLELNLSTGAAGGVRVGIEDSNGRELPGYGVRDCDALVGDDVSRVVKWAGGNDVGSFAGKPIRLRFVLKDADVFAFQFRR